MIAILATSVIVSMAGVNANGPPQQPVKIQGNVIYENGARVPDGWLVNITDITADVYLGNDTTEDVIPAIPQYSVDVNASLVIVGHVIKASVRNGDWYGEVAHTVQSGENDPGDKITMGDIVVSTNTPPNVTVETPSDKQCSNIAINYTLFDADSDTCSIEVEFKGGSHTTWTTATVSGETTGLTSSPSGVLHSITWVSTSDIPDEDAQFQIRITPSDEETTGDAGTTSDFEVDNKAPTIIFISPTPEDNEEVTENYVVVNVSISDDDVANVWLDWNETTIPPGPSSGGGGGSSAEVTNHILFASGNVTEKSSTEYIYTFNVTNLAKGEYTYEVFANDTTTCGNLGVSETRNVIVNTTTKTFELPLVEGWNLISIPMEIDNTSINAVFPDASDGDELYVYDGGWITATYYSALPGWYGDLENIEPDKGYWYRTNTAYTATIEGTEAGSRSVPIATGWNLIGYTGLSEAGLDDLIPNANDGDELYAYDGGWVTATYYSALPGWYGDLGTMQPGKGYWYRANAPFTWEY